MATKKITESTKKPAIKRVTTSTKKLATKSGAEDTEKLAIKRITDSTKNLIKTIIDSIQEKKGKDIVSMDLRKTGNAVCTHFIICHADSNTHVAAIVQSVEEHVKKKTKERAWHKEGFENAQWILLDYSNVVVHVFQREYREYYDLEGLWADAKIAKHEYEI